MASLPPRLPFLLPAALRRWLRVGCPGSLPRESARAGIAELRRRASAILGAREGALLSVGHRCGDSTRYPGSADEPRDLSLAEDVAAIMERSFEETGLDAVELDLRLDAGRIVDPAPAVYVCHDPIRPDTPRELVEYLRANSLESVLRFFISRGYDRDRRVFFELKCADAWRLDRGSAEDLAIRRSLETIERVLAAADGLDDERRAEIRRRLSFVSFNIRALERVDEVARDLSRGAGAATHGRHDLYHILATSRGVHRLLMAFIPRLRELSYLTPRLCERLVKTDILTGVWIDPGTAPDFGRALAAVNRRRAAPGPDGRPGKPPLEVFLSTYKGDHTGFLRAIGAPGARGRGAAGLIFDISGTSGPAMPR